jgi:hypothetical protein
MARAMLVSAMHGGEGERQVFRHVEFSRNGWDPLILTSLRRRVVNTS